jgi:hypothetical protein
MSGVCWRLLAQMALKGDFKARKIGRLTEQARQSQARQGYTMEQLVAMEADNDGTRY